MIEITRQRVTPWLARGPAAILDESVPPHDRENVVHVMEDWDAGLFGQDTLTVRCLVGGANNRNYLVESAQRKLVLRIASPQIERLAVDRASAIQAQRDAATAGVAPAVIAAKLPEGHVLSTFVEGVTVREPLLRNREVVREVGGLLARLHAAPSACRSFSAFDDIRHWITIAHHDGTALADDIPNLLALVDQAEQCVSAAELPVVFCHNDTVPQNFIRSSHALQLVDWDFAGKSWAAFELAAFANTAELDGPLLDELLDAYCGGGSEAQRGMIRVLSLVAAVREVAWAYMAEPMLAGSTTLMDGWTYEQFLHENLIRARSLASGESYREALVVAQTGGRRAW
jgi:thiamine kinase-like enzyme